MNDELIKRYSLAEITLLFIFMLGLILSYLFVKIRNRIRLSVPIPLSGSGLAVSLPTNSGWDTRETNWRYEFDSSMVLVAQRQVHGSQDASIRWRYVICSPGGTARDILQRRLKEFDAESVNIHSITSPVSMEYAMIEPGQTNDAALCLGVVPLDFGRHLELEVFTYQRFDMLYPQTLLKALSAGIVYQPPLQLQAGKQLVKDFWEQVASNVIALSDKADQVFLLKNLQNLPAGYVVSQFSDIGTNDDTQLQIRSQFFEQKQERRESTLWFDSATKRFRWTTSVLRPGMGRPREYSVTQEADDTIVVIRNTEKATIFACHGLLPELLLDDYAAYFLQSELDSVVVDVLASEGFVVPTVFERLDVTKASARSEQIAFVVKTDFTHNPNFFDEFYFNENELFIGRFEQQILRQRIWEISTPEQLEQIFGENYQPLSSSVADVILKINEI